MNGSVAQLFFPIALFAVFYFLLIRPQQKQQQALVKMQGALKKNDQVVTTGGLHGTVVNLKDQVITLRVDENVRMDVDRSAVARVIQGN
ncbi:MAG: preprotein translocase subunit YajC [Candidatus Omnitrophica bacterium CG11_big_fil_rev_8_21_14_0_20_64_10]|nr:MAG: preprotein translocase subunit YajC [Candidatus Omnitrophica bacterium CG11_big_fil_rev_8_21_14_0_20_64_10]